MSRLDSFIRRLEAQRACLEHGARLIERLPGPVLELGLGNGRTYDHLRALLPDRKILVFDRQVNAHPDCIPDPADLLLGDIAETLPAAINRVGDGAALAHTDLGTGDALRNARLAAWIGRTLPPLLAVGGIVIADQALNDVRLEPLPLPPGVADRRYFMYRRSAAGSPG
jgi:hypothetical protein